MTLYHVIPIKNFARGYDKYARSYRKALIPESRYPDEFYLVREDEVPQAVEKARTLCQRVGGSVQGDVLVLETQVDESATLPHPRGGFGVVYPRGEITLSCVRRTTLDGRRGEVISVEDATAWSLAEHDLQPYEALRPRSISFLPIARGCQASCSFCFSEASASADQRQAQPDWALWNRWAVEAKIVGAERAVITGGGEPTLMRDEDLPRLIRMCRQHFDKVVLITNGFALTQQSPSWAIAKLGALYGAGLSVLSVSRHHMSEDRNTDIMLLRTLTPDLLRLVVDRRPFFKDLRVRLVCVLQKGGIETIGDVESYVTWAANHGADEVCFKELYVSTSRESVYHSRKANQWSADHQVPLSVVTDWACALGLQAESRLPWGAPVFALQRNGRPMRVAAYTEPSLYWERTSGIARSWNVMADGTCLASLEDCASRLDPPGILASPEVTS